MKHQYFINLEQAVDGSRYDLSEILQQLAFNDKGLIPVITQDAATKEVLMFAWMNAEALEHTLSSRRMTYWSRSRNKLWIKGESSGHTQALVSMSFDCDGDTILCQVEQSGAACHTGRPNCFYLDVELEQKQVRIRGNASQ